jgi:cytochrome c-type biogenesis protein CcmH
MTFGVAARLALPILLLAVGLPAGSQEPGAPPALPPPGAVIPDPAEFESSVPFDDPALEAQVRKLAAELRCPTCQALSIADSPSELSQQMKEVIRDRLREGMTPEEVRQHFVSAYGEWILLSPEPRGFNLLVYVLPVVALLLGLVVVGTGIRRWITVDLPPEDVEAAPAPEEQEPVEASRGSPPPGS